jgi:hypothetical protein
MEKFSIGSLDNKKNINRVKVAFSALLFFLLLSFMSYVIACFHSITGPGLIKMEFYYLLGGAFI